MKVGLVLALVMSAIVGWHCIDNRPSSLDETKHMQLAMDYRDWVVHGIPLQNPWGHVYPPVYHFSIIPAMSFGVPTESKAAVTHGLYALIFLIGCLMLGRAQERPDDESLSAGLLTLGYCYVLWASRRALTDFPLMTWTMLATGLLARTHGFGSRKASVEWGLALGIGFLIKFTFGFFFLLPMLWTLFSSQEQGRMKNFILALVVGGIVGGSWYFWNSTFFLDKASGLVNEVTVAGGDPHTLAGWLFYLRKWPEQLGIPNLIFTAIGLVLALGSRFQSRREGDGLLWAWFFSGYLILSSMMNKDLRHTLPILPAVAFLAMRGWSAILPERWRPRVLWTAAVILFACTVFTDDLPAKENWSHAEIGRLMSERHDATQSFLAASVLAHYPRFFARGLKWSLRAQGLSLKTTGAGDPDSSFVEYIVLRHAEDEAGSPDDQEWQGTQPESRAFKTLYSICGQYTLPDKSQVVVYQRLAHPHFDVTPRTPEAVASRLTHTLKRWVQGPLKVSVRSTPQGLVDGHLEEITASCEGCQVQGVTVPSATLVVTKPWLNLYNLWDQDRIGFLAFESVGARLVLSADALREPLSKVRGVQDAHVEFADGKIRVRAKVRGIRVGAVAHTDLVLSGKHPYVDATLDWISIASIPIPGWIIGKAYRQTLWLEPQPSFPGWVRISHLTLDNQQLILQ